MAENTITAETSDAKPITGMTMTLGPTYLYEEVLMLLKPRLPWGQIAGSVIWDFYADVIESYLPTLLSEVGFSDDEDATRRGKYAVERLGIAITTWRGILKQDAAWGLISAGYDEVILRFEKAHDADFHFDGEQFAEDFKAWRLGA